MLDEITAALPADLSERVFKVVRDFRSRGASVIFISHRMAEIAMLCDRATVLRDGVTVGVTPTKGAEETIVNLMLGSDVARATTAPTARAARQKTASETVALEVSDLACGHALHGVSFRVNRGEVLGVAALEGQGQEELFDCIAGVRRADAGEVRAEGRVLKLRHPADAIRAGLVLVPANRLVSLLPQRSVQENVALAAFGRLRSWGNRGEVLGVAALEGQGQEELFDCIAGVRRADAGEVRAEGRVLKLRHPADAIRAGLVLVPANRLVSLLPQRSVQENVALAAFGRLRSWGPLRSARRDAGSTPRCGNCRSTPAPPRK